MKEFTCNECNVKVKIDATDVNDNGENVDNEIEYCPVCGQDALDDGEGPQD